MSNTIPSLRQSDLHGASGQAGAAAAQSPPQAASAPGTQPPAAQTDAAQTDAAQTDSVTLSPAAQSAAQLLGAAQSAAGVDTGLVSAIRAQLANGSYNVSPDALAQAIAAVLKETGS